LNTSITAKNRDYLWYRDYRDNRHLGDTSSLSRYLVSRSGVGYYREFVTIVGRPRPIAQPYFSLVHSKLC